MDWASVLETLGVTTIVVAIGGWAFRKLISHLFDRRIEEYRTDLQARNQQELERLKVALHVQVEQDLASIRAKFEILAANSSLRYSWLHSRRARVITSTHAKVVRTRDAAQRFISAMGYVGEPSKKDQHAAFAAEAQKLHSYFRERQIYFEVATCQKFDALWKLMIECVDQAADGWAMAGGAGADTEGRRQGYRERSEAWTRVQREFPPLLQALEAEFRDLLGVHTHTDERGTP